MFVSPSSPGASLGGIVRLLNIMDQLRDPISGCEWDVAQNFATVAPYTIEEAYEVADAIARGDLPALREELGDLLLQVVFHSRMAQELGAFDFEAVAQAISDKMEARHPHIFGGEANTEQSREDRWETRKADERAAKGDHPGALDGVALALPALMRAEKLQKRAARVGFELRHPVVALVGLAALDVAGPGDNVDFLLEGGTRGRRGDRSFGLLRAGGQSQDTRRQQRELQPGNA